MLVTITLPYYHFKKSAQGYCRLSCVKVYSRKRKVVRHVPQSSSFIVICRGGSGKCYD